MDETKETTEEVLTEETVGEEVPAVTKKEKKKALKLLEKAAKGGKGFFTEFRAFMNKGNVINLAIAFVMGAAFNAIVTALVTNIFSPLFSLILGKNTVDSLFFTVNGTVFNYGHLVMAILQFFMIAFLLFLIIKAITGAGQSVKKIVKRNKKGEVVVEVVPEKKETSDDVLKEIRDLLKAQAGMQTDGKAQD